MKRKMISVVVVMTMLLTGCSKDDSESINQDDTTDIVTTEKSIYKLVFTQTGEVENFAGVLFFLVCQMMFTM
ncbi:PBP1b-binding outer membrane lipoprotein LpoB [Wenyingzhuangia heitensis]|uniref:PBP1b-binding outer membrane lipoprotein LpoB n=1 Tax=Wenyingzhuangia heitensis TaxID=1487859 RepID=A0ABX0U8F2_9FLAO|nr:hypothetical protein [Wenyingzhuangia heitensis]NIJ44463.1 PBP1b-binding outer membrane lipoprotein LpoB [Wenyingzhuangia heitensis]